MPETLDNIKAGATQASLSQNPYMQGYLPVKALFQFIMKNKTPIKSVDTGILRVDRQEHRRVPAQKLKNGEPIG